MSALTEYRTRMMVEGTQFRRLGINPLWRPGEQDINGFCVDEVVRQYHDPRLPEDGGCRVTWMRDAWEYAWRARYGGRKSELPNVQDVIHLGRMVEPQTNALGFRTVNVYIGDRQGAPPDRVYEFTLALLGMADFAAGDLGRGDPTLIRDFTVENFEDQVADWVTTADDWYLAYEWIHPFGDGNGRTGKVLNNWIRDTLDEPYLVPDYFGGGNP